MRKLDVHGAQSFSDLQRLTDYYPATMTSYLDDLVTEGKIEQVPHKGRLAYAITKIGKDSMYEIGLIGVDTKEIMGNGGVYHDNYSSIYNEIKYYWQLPWGIQDDIVHDKNLQKINPLSKDTARAVNKFLYNYIKEDVKKKKISLDNTKDGKIILGLTIDYKDLVKSINEQSMYYLEHLSKEEQDFFEKIGDRTLNPTEQAKLDDIRKRSRARIGVRLR